MKKLIIYTKDYCPFCVRAKNLLSGKNIPFEEIKTDQDPGIFSELKEKTGLLTLPQIFIDDQLIGGFTELAELDSQGKL